MEEAAAANELARDTLTKREQEEVEANADLKRLETAAKEAATKLDACTAQRRRLKTAGRQPISALSSPVDLDPPDPRKTVPEFGFHG